MKRVRVAVVIHQAPNEWCGYLDFEAETDAAAEQVAAAQLADLFPNAGIAVQVVNRLGLEARA